MRMAPMTSLLDISSFAVSPSASRLCTVFLQSSAEQLLIPRLVQTHKVLPTRVQLCSLSSFNLCLARYKLQDALTITTGHFVIGKGLLKYCNIQKNGLKARIEPKGPYNIICAD
ncbi:unnamed protein product, partial [Cylicostephanus goldi]